MEVIVLKVFESLCRYIVSWEFFGGRRGAHDLNDLDFEL